MPSRSLTRAVLAALALAAVLAGCQWPDTPAASDAGVLYQDDFDHAQSDFRQDVTRADVHSWISGGEYVIEALEPNQVFWSTPNRHFTDTLVEADARFLAGPADGSAGLLCRQASAERFYLFELTAQGEYAIEKRAGREFEMLVDWNSSAAIHQGLSARNHLSASCNGAQLILRINGVEVARAQDAEYSAGDIGLVVGSPQAGHVRVAFDNVRVSLPGGAQATPEKQRP